ncbi:MAG TPA: chromate resistance protein ChrB domain-containing protein [Vicinamibacterales bacterium]
MNESRWLLLAHQLPTRLSNARVKTWRRLQQLGAVPARNSVYVLPNTEQCREDFEWLRREIVVMGGEATVFAAEAMSEGGSEDIVKSFQESRTQDYRVLQKDINRALAPLSAKRRPRDVSKLQRTVRALRTRFESLEAMNFFGASARDDAATALAELERKLTPSSEARTSKPSPAHKADFQGRRWVTRRRPGIDRIASAWLIRRFIDRTAMFAFVDKPDASDVPFDMYSGGFGHRGGLCTFEVLCAEFGIVRRSVKQIGQIVHDLDLKENKYAVPEAATFGRMIDGLRALHTDDATLLEQGIGLVDALVQSFEAK